MKNSEIQNLPLSTLKAMVAKAAFVPFDIVPNEQEKTISEEAALIHQLSLDELKQLVRQCHTKS